MSKSLLIWVVVIVIVILGGWYFISSQQPQAPTPTPAPQPSPQVMEEEATEGAAMMEDKAMEENVVTISSSGFSPKEITVKAGESVSWVNEDSEDHQVNSAVHPTHQLYPPLNTVGLLESGEKKSISFPDAGTYKYHDHLNPSLTGAVIVE